MLNTGNPDRCPMTLKTTTKELKALLDQLAKTDLTLTVEVTSKPKTIKIGHGYYNLKLVREIVSTLPDGDVILTSCPSKPATNSYNRYSGNGIPPKVECNYPRGHFTLNASSLNYYEADKGKVKQTRCLKYYQGDDQLANTFSLLSVTLPMEVSKC